MRWLAVALFFTLCACAETAEVALDLRPITGAEALTAVPLDSIVLRITADDFDPIEIDIEPTTTEVAVDIPSGSARRFELEARRTLPREEGTVSLLAYQGETVQSVGAGSTEIELRYQQLGAVELTANVLGTDELPEGARLVLIDERERLVPVGFGELISLRAGTYAVANAITSLGGLRAPAATSLVVPVGEIVAADIPLFRDATQCVEGSPPEVRADGAGCSDLQVDFAGLELPTFDLVINGVVTTINAADLTDGSIVLDDRLLNGVPFTISVGSEGGSPRQDCTLSGGTGVGGTDQTLSVSCGPLVYEVSFDVASPLNVPITVEADSPALGRQTVTLTDTGVITTGLFLPVDTGAPTPRVIANPAGVRCEVIDAVVPVENAVPPLRVRCVGELENVYSGLTELGDFIRNDGTSRLDATGTPCLPTDRGRDICFDAGVMLRSTLSDFPDCTGLTLRDTAGAFRWECDDAGPETVAYSTELLRLDTLLDQDGFYLSTAVEVDNGAAATVTSSAIAPFTNTTDNADGDEPLVDPDTIYFITDDGVARTNATQKLLFGDGSSLVNLSSTPFAPDETSSAAAVSVTGSFGYVVGRFALNTSAPDNTVNLQDTFTTVVAEVECNATGTGINAAEAQNIVRDTSVTDADCNTGVEFNGTLHRGERLAVRNGTAGIRVNSSDTDLRDVLVADVSTLAVRFGQSGSTLMGAELNRIGGIALDVAGNDTRIEDVRVDTAADGAVVNGFNATLLRSRFDRITGVGVELSFVNRARIDQVTVTNSGAQALIADGGRLHHISNFTAAGNGGSAAIALFGIEDSMFRNVSVVAGAGGGFSVQDGDGESADQYLEGVLIAGFPTAAALTLVRNATFHNAVFAGTAGAVAAGSSTEDVAFTGVFAYRGTCTLNGSLPVGLADPGCIDGSGVLPAPSTAAPVALVSDLSSDFAGVVTSDSLNSQVTGSPVAEGAINIWGFSSLSRVWLTDSDPFGGPCSASCQAFDLTPAATSPAVSLAPAPNAMTATRFVWGTGSDQGFCDALFPTSVFELGECVSDFLQSAEEVSGNGNGLCESGETCVYRPDAGAFALGDPENVSEVPVDVAPVLGVTLRVPQ